jgi:hypothetical protein
MLAAMLVYLLYHTCVVLRNQDILDTLTQCIHVRRHLTLSPPSETEGMSILF